MEQPAGLAALCLLILLTGCAATVSVGVPTGAAKPITLPPHPAPTRPPVAVDQPLRPAGPVVSRQRRPLLEEALSANSNAAIIMVVLRNPGDGFADMARIHRNVRRSPDSAPALHATVGGLQTSMRPSMWHAWPIPMRPTPTSSPPIATARWPPKCPSWAEQALGRRPIGPTL